MILYTSRPQIFTRKSLETDNNFTKVSHPTNSQKPVAFLHITNTEKEVMGIINYLGTNVTKEVRDLDDENV